MAIITFDARDAFTYRLRVDRRGGGSRLGHSGRCLAVDLVWVSVTARYGDVRPACFDALAPRHALRVLSQCRRGLAAAGPGGAWMDRDVDVEVLMEVVAGRVSEQA